ncbi:MAG: DUF1934 domain-containing protein [Lachnospiraceae bacterium]|nr:DUF1934 domain-containing protein [Lachnospiraceae bacterium]
MNKDVIIKVTGFSTNGDGETDTNETSSKASYYYKNGAHHILCEDEMSARTARYRIGHRTLEVIRNGDLRGRMLFEAGRTFTGAYRTPYGPMTLTFETRQYALYEENGVLRAEASYRILNGDRQISENRIVVLITEEA